MKKKEFVKLLDKFDDNDELDLRLDEDEYGKPSIMAWRCKEAAAYEVYDKIILAIANGASQDWMELCDAIHLSKLECIGLLGIVNKVHPEIKDDKILYRIDKDEIVNGMYEQAFEPQCNNAYWCIEHCTCEDDYYGQLLIPLGYRGWMVVSYAY